MPGRLEFRYYEIPLGEPLLALFGDAWIRPYGFDSKGRQRRDLHFHNLMEIGLCRSGKGEILLESRSYPYSEGTLTVIPKNYPHATRGENSEPQQWEFLFLDVEKSLLAFYPSNRRLARQLSDRIRRTAFCTCTKEHPELFSLVQQILQEMKTKDEFYRESVSGLLTALLISLARSHEKLGGQPPLTVTPQLARAMEYAEANYSRPLKTAELAAACHMSETHFRRLFARCTGMHPVDYINQIRVKKACELLKTTNRSASDICAQCGFGSVAAFNRNFRKFIGMTPGEWKKIPENYERHIADNQIFWTERNPGNGAADSFSARHTGAAPQNTL